MPLRRPGDPQSRFAIRTRELAVTLGGVDILRDANAEFLHGGINAIIGPNGAGKTTLVKAILGLIPYRGVVELRPRPDGSPPKLAYVPQSVQFDRGTPMSVCDLLCTDRQKRPLFLGHARRAVNAARAALEQVGAARLLAAPLGKLSGGEFQRVLVALALLSEPDILLLDEPVAGVDIAGGAMFCDLLVKLRDERKLTLVLVSHEMSIVVQHTNHVVCIGQDRTIDCQGDTLLTLTAANIQRIFGYHAAIYDHDHSGGGAASCDHRHHPGHHHPHMPSSHAPDPGASPTHGPGCGHDHDRPRGDAA